MVYVFTYAGFTPKTINGRHWLVKYTEDLIICKQISENGLGIDRTAYAPAGMTTAELREYLK